MKGGRGGEGREGEGEEGEEPIPQRTHKVCCLKGNVSLL